MTRKRPNTIIGPPAEGTKYLARPKLQKGLWEAILNGEHIILTAPRRVGKTSVMMALAAQIKPEAILIYENIESDGSSREFYQRLQRLLIEHLSTKDRLTGAMRDWFRSRTLTGASIKSVTIAKVELDPKAELLALVKALGAEPYRVVLMLDEFPEVLMAIRKKEGEDAALDILHTLREIRHSADFKNFSTVIAGSIGLQHVVSMMGRLTTINDTRTIDIPVLTEAEAQELLDLMLNEATIQLDGPTRQHMLNAVGHLLPFHLQLLTVEIDRLAEFQKNDTVTPAMVDEAADRVVRMNDKFQDWELRLTQYLPKADTEYCMAVLTRCAHWPSNTVQQAYDLSKTIIPERSYMALIQDVLEKDGYIAQQGNQLVFLSPFLRRWWANRHPAHEISN
jgi:hypothetical protein